MLRSLAARVAISTLAVSALAVAVVSLGVLLVGSSEFDRLMVLHGATVEEARQMFNHSVTWVLAGASLVAIAGSLGLAYLLARGIERPLGELARAARRIAEGGYDSRVSRPSTPELASVADSFNQMAAALADQERQRQDLVQNFAHELRTPLTNLHGYLEGLRDGVVEPGPEVFASLQDEVARLHRLSRSLDDLAARPGAAHQAEEIELAPTIRALLELGRTRFERRSISVRADVPAGLRVCTDPDTLAQVVGNLLQNAARYTEPGGRVDVRAERQADSIVVSVANTGSGIPPSDLPHVFERFYRVEKSRDAASGGLGIGLAIVKQLVESAGGQVGAACESGVTRFWFRLPA